MVMAGLWETWRSPANETVCSATIITCPPNALVAELHNRMPVPDKLDESAYNIAVEPRAYQLVPLLMDPLPRWIAEGAVEATTGPYVGELQRPVEEAQAR